MLYLWLSFGFTFHELIQQRIRGLEEIQSLKLPSDVLMHYRSLYRDASFVDGWFVAFVGPDQAAIDFSKGTIGFLLVSLGLVVSIAHACTLAVASIGSRRYLLVGSKWAPLLYYVSRCLLYTSPSPRD